MTTTPKASVSEAQLQQMATEILQEIPGAEVRLYSYGKAFGYDSRARGEARPDSDIHLLV
jgi:predicted nucleotidyltransferase